MSNSAFAKARQVLAALLLVLWSGPAVAQEANTWTGEWNSFWRSGRALMLLNQEGERVFGFYEPGDGRIEGRIEDGLLNVTWEQLGGTGTAVFALSPDGMSFTGRYANGEFWNGARVTEQQPGGPRFLNLERPKDTLNAVVTAANDAVIQGNAASVVAYEPVLFYADGAEDERERLRRRTLLWRIVNLSTFRTDQAPADVAGDRAVFAIGPSGSDERYDLPFRRREDGKWQVVVEPEAGLEAHLARLLDDLGHDTLDDQRRAEANSPRQTMKDFLLGMKDWDRGGADSALATLDLSYLPQNLRDIEGPIVADYLKQILDRAGFVTWQEIPNDPDRAVPYVHYRHPVGNIAIVAKEGEEGQPSQWLFSAESLEAAPDLFDAVQNLPLAQGLDLERPVSDYFRMREALRDLSPVLVERGFILENWIWGAILLGLVLAFVLARLAGWLGTWLLTLLFVREEGTFDAAQAKRFDWPLRILVAGLLLRGLFVELGLAQRGFSAVTTGVGVVTVLGAVLVCYSIVSALGAHFLRHAQETEGYADEIVTSLVTGLAKLTIIIMGAIAAADVVGLPYLGIITGLGVGGVALAFAARETVSNLLGGALLMADRPFSRGDLIETEGQYATIENVGLRSTRLRTFDDAILIIPNAQLSEKAIVNWGKRRRRKIQLEIGLTYDTPRDKLDRFVERLRQIYEEQPRADKAECYVGLKSFGASSIDIHLWGYFKVYGYDAQVRAQHALIGDIIELAKELGVSFAFPTRTLHIAEGEDQKPARPDKGD